MRAAPILQIVADGNPGGGTTNVLALIEDLMGAGLRDMDFISQSGSYALERATELGATIHGIDFFRSRFDPTVPWRISRMLGEVKPRLIHVHGARAGFFLSLVPSRGIPVVYTVRGYHFLGWPRPIRDLAARAEKRASAHADVTVHVCQYDRRLAQDWNLLGPRRGVVIHNGIRVSDIPLPDRPRPRTVGFLGRLTAPKDPLLVVEVARILAPEGFRFKLIGGGELEGAVRERLARYRLLDHVELLGSLAREEALEALRDVELFLLPSRREGLPIAPVEAMQMRIPVIAARVSGIPEIVEHGVSGVLIDDRSPASYARAIRDLSADPARRERYAEAGLRIVAEKFTRERVTMQHLRLYEDLLGGPSPSSSAS